MTEMKCRYKPELWDFLREELPCADVVVELGVMMGEWTRAFQEEIGAKKLFAIDIWPRHKGRFERCWRRFQEHLEPWLFKSVFPLRGDAFEWGRDFPCAVDLLYHDACHRSFNVVRDLSVWYPRLKPGGLCLIHDAHEKGVKAGVKEFFGDAVLTKEFFGPKKIPTLWIRKQSNGA